VSGHRLLERSARAALAACVAGLPACRAAWGRAMLAEVDAIEDPGERLRWTAGALSAAVRVRVRPRPVAAWAAGVVAAGALAGLVDWSPSDMASQATLLVLLLASAGLGFAVPSGRLATGLVLGSAVALLHLVSLGLGLAPPYRMEPPGVAGALSLLVLVVPATLAALAGGAARRRLTRR
jgi:hypothetical protein